MRARIDRLLSPARGGRAPSLELNLLRPPAPAPLQLTRAGAGTCFGPDGALRTIPAHQPRYDHDPVSVAPRGLLLEEGRTNLIPNGDGVGSVVGVPGTPPSGWGISTGGLTRSIAGAGTQNGIPYVDIRLHGTAAAGTHEVFLTSGRLPVSAGTPHAFSVWVARSGGSAAGITQFQLTVDTFTALSGGSFVGAAISTDIALGTGLTRHGGTGTTATGSAAAICFLRARHPVGTVIDITYRIGGAQLEAGGFPTSYIPTTTAAASRPADLAMVPGGPWLNPAEGTLLVEYSRLQPSAPGMVAELKGPSTSTGDRIGIMASATADPRFQLFPGGPPAVLETGATFGAQPAGTVIRAALAYRSGDSAALRTGGAVVTSTAPFAPPAYTELWIGSTNNGIHGPPAGLPLNGHVRLIRYWRRRIANASLLVS